MGGKAQATKSISTNAAAAVATKKKRKNEIKVHIYSTRTYTAVATRMWNMTKKELNNSQKSLSRDINILRTQFKKY